MFYIETVAGAKGSGLGVGKVLALVQWIREVYMFKSIILVLTVMSFQIFQNTGANEHKIGSKALDMAYIELNDEALRLGEYELDYEEVCGYQFNGSLNQYGQCVVK